MTTWEATTVFSAFSMLSFSVSIFVLARALIVASRNYVEANRDDDDADWWKRDRID